MAQQGYVIQATKVRDPQRFVACTDKEGRLEQYGLFELRRIEEEAPGHTKGRRHRWE